MTTKKVTSIKIDPSVWKEVKIYCVTNDMEISEFVEKALKKELNKK